MEGDHFYVDLVFCNRLLRCFVLIDLKLGKLTHQVHASRYQLYLPTEEELREQLAREREEAERTLRLSAAEQGDGEG
ncbi:MAG: DUF1016 domain-containing protein [Myxococcales bacterium FL481]|nr:MAG: DUF1016 domain-containing protein [Myxococcales bacterium FL481]